MHYPGFASNIFKLFFSDVLAIARTYKASAQYVTKLPFFEVFVNFDLAISRPFYFGVTLCQNLTYFFQVSWRSQGHTKQVHNISQKFVVFSTICKL